MADPESLDPYEKRILALSLLLPSPALAQNGDFEDQNQDILKGMHVIVGTPHHLARGVA